MKHLLRHYLFGHFRWFICCLAGAAASALVVFNSHNRELFFFAGGVQVTWSLLALGGAVAGVIEVFRCRRKIGEIDEAFERMVTLTRDQNLSDAGPPLVQRVNEGFRITWISADNRRTFAMAMSEDHAHHLANKLHEGLYG